MTLQKPTPPQFPSPPQPSWFGIGIAKLDPRELEERNKEYQRALEKYNLEKSALMQRYQEQELEYAKQQDAYNRQQSLDEEAKKSGYKDYGDYLFKRAEEVRNRQAEEQYTPFSKKPTTTDIWAYPIQSTKKELTAEDIFAYPIQTGYTPISKELTEADIFAYPIQTEKYQGSVEPFERPTGFLESARFSLSEQRSRLATKEARGEVDYLSNQADMFVLGIGASILSQASFLKNIVTHPITTSKEIGGGIINIGRRIVSGKGFPELGKTLSTQPAFATGYIGGELLGIKGISKLSGLSKESEIAKLSKLSEAPQVSKTLIVSEKEAEGLAILQTKATSQSLGLKFPTGRLISKPAQFEAVAVVPFIKVGEGNRLIIEEAKGLSAIKSGNKLDNLALDISGRAEKIEGAVSRITKEAGLSKAEKIKELDISASEIKFKPIISTELKLKGGIKFPSGKFGLEARGIIKEGGDIQRIESLAIAKEDEGIIRFVSGEVPKRVKISKEALESSDILRVEPTLAKLKLKPSSAGIIARREALSIPDMVSSGGLVTKTIKSSALSSIAGGISKGLKETAIKSVIPKIESRLLTKTSPSLIKITQQAYTPSIKEAVNYKTISSLAQLPLTSTRTLQKQAPKSLLRVRQEQGIKTLTKQLQQTAQAEGTKTKTLTRQLQGLRSLERTKQMTRLAYGYASPFISSMRLLRVPRKAIFRFPQSKYKLNLYQRGKRKGREDIALSPSFTGRVMGFKQIVRGIKDIERLAGQVGARGEVVIARPKRVKRNPLNLNFLKGGKKKRKWRLY